MPGENAAWHKMLRLACTRDELSGRLNSKLRLLLKRTQLQRQRRREGQELGHCGDEVNVNHIHSTCIRFCPVVATKQTHFDKYDANFEYQMDCETE